MCKCWKCGAEQHIGKPPGAHKRINSWRAQSTAARWTGTGYQDLERQPDPNTIVSPLPNLDQYREIPVRAPDPVADVVVPGMMTGVVAIVATVDAAVLMLNVHFNQWPIRMIESLALGPPTPTFAFYSFNSPLALLAVSCISATLAWAHYTGVLRSTLWRIEEILHIDLDRDKSVGEPEPKEPALSPFPVRTGLDKAASSTTADPEPVQASAWIGKTTKDTPIVIRHAEKNRDAYEVTLGFLWDFLRTSYTSGWTKKAWKARGLPYEKWKDLQDFFLALNPKWWKIEDSPTLDLVLSRFCYPVSRPTVVPTDRTAKTEE